MYAIRSYYAHYYRGLALYDRGELQQAVIALKEALKGSTDPFRIYYKLGMAQYGQGNLIGSIHSYQA